MSDTLELGLQLPGPAVPSAEVERLVAVLREGGGWMTAEEIAAKMEKTTERRIRKVASAAAPAIVSFPGSPGYKLWANCTVEEINHAIEAFESQARDMIKRANLFRRAYHRRFRATS